MMKVPKNWNKVPLENFVHYLEYIDEVVEMPENPTAEDLARYNEQAIDLITKKTCAILGCSVEESKLADHSEVMKLTRMPMPTRLMLSFKHKGKRYRPIIKVKELSGAKYTAIKNSAKRGTKDNLHQILYLACEERRFGFKKSFPFIGFYDYTPTQEEVEQGISDFKTLPMEVANPISLFFLNLSKQLKSLLDDYSIETLKKMTEDMATLQASLEKDMDGLQ